MDLSKLNVATRARIVDASFNRNIRHWTARCFGMDVSGTLVSTAGIVRLVTWGITSITVLRCPNINAVDLVQALVRTVKKWDHVKVDVLTQFKARARPKRHDVMSAEAQ
ncbi:unnamed protein product [Mortierella alpina]